MERGRGELPHLDCEIASGLAPSPRPRIRPLDVRTFDGRPDGRRFPAVIAPGASMPAARTRMFTYGSLVALGSGRRWPVPKIDMPPLPSRCGGSPATASEPPRCQFCCQLGPAARGIVVVHLGRLRAPPWFHVDSSAACG